MKSFSLYVCLTFVTICFSQDNKLDSIRWVRLPKNTSNNAFFQDTYTNRNFTTLIGCFWENTRNSSNVFFIEHADIAEKQKLYFELKKWSVNDSLLIGSYNKRYVKKIDSLFNENIVFNFNQDIPFVNESGEVYDIDCVGFFQFVSGQICFAYPPDFAILMHIWHLSEVRIREEIQFNTETKEYKYIPTAVQLYTNHQDNLENTIWLDLVRLKQNNPEILQTKWFQAIISKSYTGEQYMQLKRR